LIADAIKAVLGVGKKSEGKYQIKPTSILWFAFLVAFFFLGSITGLLLLVSLVI
jgi:hypothetical protein|tara:strand:- start:149 stop:310 length:162 start_codon:yes stop_codon:yes gene_type:complete